MLHNAPAYVYNVNDNPNTGDIFRFVGFFVIPCKLNVTEWTEIRFCLPNQPLFFV